MTDKIAATPGPWQVIENDGAYVKDNRLARYRIETAPESGRDLCVALVVTDTPELNNGANADQIVLAVNAHDDLVASLTELTNIMDGQLRGHAELAALSGPPIEQSKAYQCASDRIARARAALAKAQAR